MKKVMLVLCALLLLAFAAIAVLVYTTFRSKPLTKAEQAELEIDWTPATKGNWSPWFVDANGDTVWSPVQSYNAWVETIPEDQRVWSGLSRINSDPYREITQHWSIGTFPGEEPGWEELAPLLRRDDIVALVDALAESLTMPYMGMPIGSDRYLEDGTQVIDPFVDHHPLFDAPLHSLGRHRNAITLLQSSALVSLADGDTKRFLQLTKSMLTSLETANEPSTLISQLVRIAILSVINETVLYTLTTTRVDLDTDLLMQLTTMLAPHADWTPTFVGEIMSIEGIFRFLAGTDGSLGFADASRIQSNTTTRHDAFSEEISSASNGVQRSVLLFRQHYRQAELLATQDFDGDLQSLDDVYSQEKQKLGAVPRKMIEVLLPATNNVIESIRRSRFDTRVTLAALAIEIHQREHGAYPTTLDELGPVAERFIDPNDGKPLRYLVDERGPVLYSVGPDGVDNQGTQLWRESRDDVYREVDDPEIFDEYVHTIVTQSAINPWYSSRHVHGRPADAVYFPHAADTYEIVQEEQSP